MILSMKNKYIVRSRISEKKFREILWYFSADIEAVKIAEFTDISEKTINLVLALSLRKEVEAQQIKHQYSVCLKETAKFIPR